MRWLWVSCLLLASLLPLPAEDWTTEDGKTYRNVTVVGQEDDGVRITYDGGVGKIPYYELPADLQKRFGQDIDSLAAKKQAVDKAIDDAVRSAVDAQAMVMPVAPPAGSQGTVPGGYSPQYGVPGNNAGGPSIPAGEGSPATGPNGAPSSGAPGSPSGTSTAAAGGPGAPSGAGAPGNPSGPNAPKQPGPNGAAPGAGAPGTPGHPGTSTAATPGGHGAVPGGAPSAGPNVSLPELEEPMPSSSTPEPTGVTGAGGRQLQLTTANYTYNPTLDVSYLDSPAIDVYADPPPKTPLTAGQGSSLTFRIVTDGRTPQVPDRFEVTFLSVGVDNGDLSARAIVFSTDAGTIPVDDSERKDSGSLPGGGQHVQYASFYLPAAQVRQICSGKPLTFSVGPTKYRIDQRGATILHNYFTDADSLEPATSSLLHTVYKLLGRIPSFFNIISTICEYVILGSFGLLVAASIAAFILGISRFIKM